MTINHEPLPDEGRPVLLTPVRPGVWLVLLGSGVVVLGPLFGFLIGTMLGTGGETLGMAPIYLFLFLGFIAAGFGMFLVLLGVRRILRDVHAREPSSLSEQAPTP